MAEEQSRYTVVYRASGRRTFKACRTCRQQKVRCIGADKPPCKRCRATGRDCVFEEMGRSGSGGRASGSIIRRVHARSDGTLVTSPGRVHGSPGSGSGENNSSPTNQAGNTPPPSHEAVCHDCYRTTLSPKSIDQLHIDAPITAVHEMASSVHIPPSPLSGQSDVSVQLQGPGQVPIQPVQRSLNGSISSALPPSHCDDVVSAGLVTESTARKLFQLYMANANVFLPLFDPATDTFDVIRKRSPLCLAIVLAVALRADATSLPNAASIGERCFQEAQNLAMKSLFSSTPCLESVQGMLLLAAYSTSNWFAVKHACQMGLELGLTGMLGSEDCFETLPEMLPGATHQPPGPADLIRYQRTALVLHQVEEEIGSGRAQRNRRRRVVDDAVLHKLLGNEMVNHHDMRIVSTIQIVQLRVHLLEDLQSPYFKDGSIIDGVQRAESRINAWFHHWDTQLQSQNFSESSFYRSSLRLQRDYAFIIVCSSILSKIRGQLGGTVESSESSESPEGREQTGSLSTVSEGLIGATLERSSHILSFIGCNNDYKWYLPWAPTFSALFPAFTAALAFRLARHTHQLSKPTVGWTQLQRSFTAVADILQSYPYRHFSHLVRSLADLCDKQAMDTRNEAHTKDVKPGPATFSSDQSAPSTATDTLEGPLPAPAEANSETSTVWPPFSSIHYDDWPGRHTPQLGHPDEFGAASLGVPEETRDYMLAFDYFAASMETVYASLDGDHVQ